MDKRMSDAALNSLSYAVRGAVRVPLLSSYRELRAELDRARASESALLARVAELEAAAAGETGTPKAEGRYWCETSGSPEILRWWLKCWWRNDSEALPRKEQTGYVLRFHRLRGETYTSVEKPK